MNLIEQLGSYEIKIPDYECYQYHKESLETYEATKHLSVFGMTAFKANLVHNALLQYRREHNIFDVGDFIFHPMFGALFEIKRIAEKYVVASTKSGYETNLLIELISHATPEEIQAGHRL